MTRKPYTWTFGPRTYVRRGDGRVYQLPAGSFGSILGGQTVDQGSQLPPWASDVMDVLGRGPASSTQDAGGFPGLSPQSQLGPFSDVMSGFNNMPADNLFGGFQNWPQMGRDAGGLFNMFGMAGGTQGFNQNWGLSDQAMNAPSGPNNNNQWLSSLTEPSYGSAIDYAGPIMGMLSGRTGGQASPFSGQAAGAALDQMKNTGPNGDIYNRTLAMAIPQVRASYAARGLGGGGAAANAESQMAQNLADQFAQRAMQERIGLLGQAVGGEGANASMTGALGSTMASMLGSRLQGAIGATRLPGQVQGDFLANMGQNVQNNMGLAGLNMTPTQAAAQGQGLSMQSLQEPLALNSQLYNLTRNPYLQLLQAASGASPLGKGSDYRGFLGIPK